MARPSETRLVLWLVAADLLAVLVAYGAAFALRILVPLPLTTGLLPAGVAATLHHALAVALLTQAPLLYLFGLYDPVRVRRGARLLLLPAGALGIQLLLISASYYFLGDLGFPRSVLLLFTGFNVAGVAVSRAVARWHLLGIAGPTRIVLVGSSDQVADLRSALAAADPRGQRVEVVATRESSATPNAIDLPPAGDVDLVLVVAGESWKDSFLDRLLRERPADTRPRVAVVPTVYDLLVGRLTTLSIADVPLIEVVKDPQDRFAMTLKAGIDYLLAGTLAILALPVCALAILATALTSPGPVLFRQRRVGRNGAPFVMYKLRTMRLDAEADTGPILAEERDDRVTPVGRFLRSTRIDELPQLWNVLTGTMSLVGPRPERPEFAERYQREIPGYAERWLVKPGVSGLAQVRGEYHTPTAYKLKYDLAYIYNYSLALDLRIMAETVQVLLTRRGV